MTLYMLPFVAQAYAEGTALTEMPPGITAPDFSLEDINGTTHTLSGYRGKVVVVNFWATWCAPCKKELPKLDRLHDRTSRDQLKIILINIEKKKFEDIQSFLDNLSIKNLTSYFDNDLKLTRDFGLRGIPITLIVNSDKKEVARVIGDLDFTDPKFIEWVKSY